MEQDYPYAREGRPLTHAELEARLSDPRHVTAYVETVAKNVPRWCVHHDDFGGIARFVLVRAARDYDPARGRFVEHLAVRARSRVARLLVRRYRLGTELTTDAETMRRRVEEHESNGRAEVAGAEAIVLGNVRVTTFLQSLPEAERRVAGLLIEQFRQSEIARLLGIHPRSVSRIVDRLRVKAAIHFDVKTTAALAA